MHKRVCYEVHHIISKKFLTCGESELLLLKVVGIF